jgi:hypothetical protein
MLYGGWPEQCSHTISRPAHKVSSEPKGAGFCPRPARGSRPLRQPRYRRRVHRPPPQRLGASSHRSLAPYIGDDAGGTAILSCDRALRVDLPVRPHRGSVVHCHSALRGDAPLPTPGPWLANDAVSDRQWSRNAVWRTLCTRIAPRFRRFSGDPDILSVECRRRRRGSLCDSRRRHHASRNHQKYSRSTKHASLPAYEPGIIPRGSGRKGTRRCPTR